MSVPGLICAFSLHPDGTTSMPYASPSCESVFGFSPEAVSSDFNAVLTRIHPDDFGHVEASIAKSANTLQPWHNTFRYQHPDKGERWIVGHSVPQREQDGSILWHGYIQDITDRKLIEAELSNQEIEIQLIMDATPALISYLDTNCRYLRVNATYENWMGIKLENILGHEVREIIGETSWHIVRPYFERALAGEQVNFDQMIPYGDRKARWVNATYVPHKDASGKVKGIVVHVVDIEERKQVQEALLASKEFVNTVLDSLPEHVVVLDAQGNVVAVNAPWQCFAEENGGSPENTSVGSNYLEVCRKSAAAGDACAQQALEGLQALLDGRQQEFSMEYPCQIAKGARWFLMRSKRLIHGSQGVILTHTDITENKNRQELDLRSKAMEQECRQFVASQTASAIAHELNQPLTAISSYSEAALLMLKKEHSDSPRLVKVLESCVQQAQRAGDSIRQLMNFLHKGESISEPVQLNDLIQDALDFVKSGRSLAADLIELNLAADLPMVKSNSLQMQKVLVNLINNGLDALQHGNEINGKLTVTSRRSASDPEKLQVTVCDNGVGVTDASQLKTMFQPFHTTKANGLGMGLAISRALIESHHGKMWAEQNAEQGISLHFTLPFTTEGITE